MPTPPPPEVDVLANHVQWGQLLGILRFIAGIIGTIALIMVSGLGTTLWAVGRWVGRIETKVDGVSETVDHLAEALEESDKDNRAAHEQIRDEVRANR